MQNLKFLKMNGAGNDFVVFDARGQEIALSPEQIRSISARDNAISKGCDQLLVLEKSSVADVFMRIYNADGSEVNACGNATRCVASLLEKELGRLPVSIETNAAVLYGVQKERSPAGIEYVLVDMGAPKFDWQEIPLSMPTDEAAAKIKEIFGLGAPFFVNIGNPHVVFFMPQDAKIDIEKLGSAIENYTAIFPQRVNVTFATIIDSKTIHAKVWERGAGLTKACGTASCAMLAAANQIDSRINAVSIVFANSGESVSVKLADSGHILLGGAVEVEFDGVLAV